MENQVNKEKERKLQYRKYHQNNSEDETHIPAFI